jgi:HEAT repeat protein
MTADINPVVRSAAVYALCRKKNSAFNQTQSAAELLRKDPSPFVRVAAAGCLPFNSDTLMAVDTLKNAVLTQDNINIKLAAAAALITINTPHSLDIAKEFTNGPLTPFKINLLAMLTVLKDKKTEMRFLDALNDEIAQNRAAGIKKLLETGIENPEFFLKKALKDEPVAAVAAAQELIKISKETKAALSRLEQIWKEGGNFAEQAKKVMAAAGSKEALDSIAADLKETGSDGRNAAGLLIEKYKDITALRPLFVHLLASEHQKIRVEAARAVIFQCMLSSRQH